ncbi:MAG: gamma-glutamyltransferase, partial [Bacteroidetes bacterium]|nr:gamma-glutamyltransferase [Bacteroidota bacterium]
RRPLVFSFNGYDVYTNPPPSSGGTLMAFILKLFATHGLEAMKFGDHRHISVLADAMRLTDKAREEAFDGKQYRHGIADSFLNDHFNLYDPVFRQHALKVGTTTHITVADGLGNIACTTTSHGEGCGYIIPGTDIMLNNMLGEEDLNPGGFHRWPPSSRITSMMAPTIAVREGKPVIATGTGGANRIRTAVAQVLINYLYFGMPIEDAVSKPRFHWHERILDIEPGFWPSELERTEVPETDKKVVWQKKAMYFGGNHSIGFDREGTPAGAGDPRRSGIVMEC